MELRVVAIEASLIETQGRAIFNVTIDNRGQRVAFAAATKTPRWGEMLKLRAKAPGMSRIFVVHNTNVLGQIDGAEGELSVDPRLLGLGPVRLQAIGVPEKGLRELVGSAPLSLTVEPGMPLGPVKDAPKSTSPGLAVKLASGKTVPVQETRDQNWLSLAGVNAGQTYVVQSFFQVNAPEVYQFQLWHDGELKLTVERHAALPPDRQRRRAAMGAHAAGRRHAPPDRRRPRRQRRPPKNPLRRPRRRQSQRQEVQTSGCAVKIAPRARRRASGWCGWRR